MTRFTFKAHIGLLGRGSLLVGALCLASFAGPALAGGAAHAQAVSMVFGVPTYLPVVSDGARYVSTPYGDAAQIQHVAATARQFGAVTRVSSRGMEVPADTANQALQRYDFTYPATCGGGTFSYFEGRNFRALGYHYNGKIILDAIAGAGPYAAPRLWGPYDQVLNEHASMRMLFGTGKNGGFGLSQSSYLVGVITNMPAAKRAAYGEAYTNEIHQAAACDLRNYNGVVMAAPVDTVAYR